MKVLVISSHYPPYHIGGYELRCKNVLDRLSQRGHEIEVITSKVPKEIGKSPKEESNIHRRFHILDSSLSIPQRVFRDYLDVKFLHKVLNSFMPDLVYIFQVANITKSIFPYLAERDLPIVYDEGGASLIDSWMHGGSWYAFIESKNRANYKNKIKALIGKNVCKISGGLIKNQWDWPHNFQVYFNSEIGKQKTMKAKVPVEGALIIHSGVDIKRFSFLYKKRLTPPIRILAPGRLVPKKGQKDAIHLMSQLMEHGLVANLTLVGKHVSETYQQEMLEMIRSFDLENVVRVIPMIENDDLVRLYHESHICFFSSNQKYGFSRVPLEAMASGCLVISYGNEGSDEIIEDGKNGCIVTEGDYEAITTIVQEVISNPEKYRQMIRTARRVIEQNHSMDAYVDKIEAILIKSIKPTSNQVISN